MPKSKSRTLFYRRVDWVNGKGDSLEKYLSKAHNSLNTTSDRTFQHSDGEIQGLAIQHGDSGILVHLAFYTPKQHSSLVPVPSKAKSKNTSSIAPPEKHNYLDGDIFFLVKGNHIVLCPSGARESVALSYINQVLRKQAPENVVTRYSIEPVAKIDKVKLLQQEGVKKIALNSSLYEATMAYTERTTTKMSLLNSVAEEFLGLFKKDSDKELQNLGEMENLSVKLEISFDSRKKDGELGRQRLQETANMLISDEEDQGFTIITGGDNRLTADEIRISDKVSLTPHGNSVSRQSAFEALKIYMQDLYEAGVLEQ